MADTDKPVRPLVEPTEGEKQNGWTAATLTAYLAERDRASSARVMDRKPPRPTRAKSKYDAFRWRG